ncbi:putative major sperm protein (MSP) [Dioscorea sansibarensis]
MEKLVEIMEDEILIEFKPMIKCRTEIHVRSLHPTAIITFKVQSTAPSRFHVTPPSGLLQPLSMVALRVTLRPQPELPASTDRFLIKASLDSKTQDMKLRVSYTGALTDGDFSYFNPLFKTSVNNNSNKVKPEEPVEKETEEMVLLVAARRGDIAKLQSLLKKKPAGAAVGIDSKDQYNTTALHCAAMKGHRDAVSMLVAFGIEIESQDVEGHTALHLAVEGGSLETTEMLINLGADVEAKTNRGATPLRIARSMGYAHIEHLLTSRGASI